MTLLTSVLLGSVLLSGAAEAAPVPKPDFKLNLEPYDLPMVDYNFPSGLRVIFQEDRTQPVVAVTVVIDRGSEADPIGKEGIAHVAEHMVFKAKHGDLPKNWDVLQELGAMINASTSVDWTDYLTVAPKDALIPIMRIEAMRLVDGVAKVTAEELSTELEVVRNELRMRYENAAIGAAWEDLGALMYPQGHPYSRTTIGTHETLSNIDIQSIRDFVSTNYTPSNSTIVVVGDIDLEKTGEIVQEAFRGLEEQLLVDPKNPKAPLELKEVKSRVDCAGRAEPPAPVDRKTRRVKGPVEKETVVVAWSLPGGYCSDEPAMEMAANLLPNYIYRTLVPAWEWSNREQSITGLGCFLDANQFSSRVICYVEPKAGLKGDKLVSKVADSLYLQWDRQILTDPVWRPFLDYADRSARASYMTGLFQGLDNVASLSGRATQLAHYAHFTGSVQYFADSIKAFTQMDRTSAMAIAEKYLTRDRMVSVVVEPMDENERAQREANAKAANGDKKPWEGATAELAYSTVFDATALTPEAIMRTTVLPDVKSAKIITLSNGMRVTLMPHGVAPLVRAGLIVRGSDNTAEHFGLDSLAEGVLTHAASMDEDLRAVAGTLSMSETSVGMRVVASGSSGNLDALFYALRNTVSDLDWSMADRKGAVDGWESDMKRAGKEAATWADRLRMARLLPGSPMGRWWDPDTFTAVRALTPDQMKAWVARKYQPSNVELIVVGRMDLAKAEAAARAYFEGWTTTGGGEPPKPTFAPPSSRPDRQILVFDQDIATQTQVDLVCQLTPADASTFAARQVLGDTVSQQAFRKLREEGGLTYGAYAYTQTWPGGTSIFGLSSLVQNNAVGYAVKTMIGLAEKAGKGELDPSAIARQKWALGREYVYGETSGAQLWSRLAGTREMGFDYDFYETWRSSLASISPDIFPKLMEPCLGHEIITVVGPKDAAEAQLKEVGLAYEVVDWEKLHEGTLSEKERKELQKSKAKEEAEKAKKGSGLTADAE